jgi:hypothetical protein
MIVAVASNPLLTTAGGSFSAVSFSAASLSVLGAGFRLRWEISFPILFSCGEVFSSGQNGTAESFPSRNKGVTNAIDFGCRATTLDGTGIESVSCLFSIVNIWLSDCN